MYGLIVIYALCYQLQQPIEPFLVDKLVKQQGGDASKDAGAVYGRVQSFFGVAQAVGSLAIGAVIDKLGVRAGFIITFLSCAASYYILSVTTSIEMLFVSKIPAAFVAGFLCAQTAIAKVTEEGEDRITALGRLTTAYTIGGIGGPYLGGILGASGDYFIGAQYATAGCLFAACLVMLLPKKLDNAPSHSKKSEADLAAEIEADRTLSWSGRVGKILSLVGLYLFVKVGTGIANNMARSAQPLIFKDKFSFDEAMMGTVMAGQFAFGGFANAFLLSPLTKVLGGHVSVVVRNCVAIMGFLYVANAMLYSNALGVISVEDPDARYPYIGVALTLALFQFSLASCITADTTTIVPKHMTGTLMGVEHALFAVAGIFGPVVGVSVFQYGDETGQGITALQATAGGLFLAILCVWVALHKPKTATAEEKKKK